MKYEILKNNIINDFKINNYKDGPKIEKYKVQEFYNKNNKFELR